MNLLVIQCANGEQMARTTEWPEALENLEDKELYTLKALQKIISEYGHDVEHQAIYRWIKRRNVRKRGTVPDTDSPYDLVVWLGADLKNAFYEKKSLK